MIFAGICRVMIFSKMVMASVRVPLRDFVNLPNLAVIQRDFVNVIPISSKHESHFFGAGDDMARAWSPLPRQGRGEGEGRINATQRGCKSNPSPSSSPLLRGERRQGHAREPILILIDLEM